MTTDIETSSRDRVRGRVRFGVLGPLTVTEEGDSFNLGGVKQRTVLAMLVAHAGNSVSIDVIIEAVWGEETPSGARRNAQTYVSTLRRIVGEAIEKTSQGWKLVVERSEVDSLAFEDLFDSAAALVGSNPERASVALREALALWRGHPFADIEAHGILDGEITRLAEMRRAAQAARIDADLALSRHSELIGEIEALTVEHPYSERFRAQHMLALYRAGRQEEALRSYQRLRSTLVDELGVDPTQELQELEAKILQQDESLALVSPRTVQRRAVLVADPGDPIEVGHLPPEKRSELLRSLASGVDRALKHSGGGLTVNAGSTTFVVLDQAESAAKMAETLMLDLAGSGARVAIDFGDVVVEDCSVSGAPVSRAAVIAAVGHLGQVLLSADAQQEIAAGGGKTWRYESLGTHDLPGVEDQVLVYQLLVGDQESFPPLDVNRLPPPLPGGTSRSIPGYELREPVGQGSIGTLYRAFQPSVGREVLVEVIGRSQSSDIEFIRRFEADAQRLSLLDHQNIAQVIDYWRQPDGAFLVYRYPRGGFLHQASGLDTGRVIDQVGAGLAHAHSFGMVHGSLRPDRVVLDEAGNAALIGFPIVSSLPRRDSDFPAYIAPESLAGEPATAATDLFALAVMANELMAGRSPDDAAIDPAHPAIGRAIADDPASRHGSVVEFLVELNPARDDSPADRYTETRNPYKGLAAFHEGDAEDFFGRGEAVEELLERLDDSSMLAVVGPSGVGKSSVVRAGLVPALRANAIEGSADWVITDMLPGSHPFLELSKSLERVAVDLPVQLREALAGGAPGALDDIDQMLPGDFGLVIVVDQFEELFTMTGEDERVAFLDLLVRSANNPRVRTVLTLRADFLDRPLRYSQFGDILRSATVMLRAPKPNELAEAISRPAEGVDVVVEPSVVERMIAEVHDQPGALPLLQHSLAVLFETRATDLIDTQLYEGLGGVAGSLATRAEDIYGALDRDQRSISKQLFLRLVSVIDDAAPTRRRLRVNELDDIGAQAVIGAFARSRLLVMDSDPETRVPTVEVAHEALLSHWPRLAGWIEAARQDLVQARRLDEAIAEWEASDRLDSYLLTGGRLAQHEVWTADTTLTLSPLEIEFLAASSSHDHDVRLKRRRRRQWIMGGFAAAAVVAVVLAISASNARDQAVASELATAAIDVLEDDPELALLLGIASADAAGEPGFETRRALHAAIDRSKALATIEHEAPFAWTAETKISPDGSLLIATGNARAPGDVYRVTEDGPEFLWRVPMPDEWSIEAAFTADSRRLVVAANWPDWDVSVSETVFYTPEDSSAAGLYVFDARTGELLERPDLSDLCELPTHQLKFVPIAAGDVIGFCRYTTTWWIVDTETWSVHVNESKEPIFITIGAANGSIAKMAFGIPPNTTDHVVDVATGESRVIDFDLSLSKYQQWFPSGDGNFAAIGASILDLGNGELIRTFVADEPLDSCGEVPVFTPDESLLYLGCEDGTSHVFRVSSGEHLVRLEGHTGWSASGSFSADGSWLATGASDGTVRLWTLADRAEVRSVDLGPGYYADAAIDVFDGLGAAVVYPNEEETLFHFFWSAMTRHAVADLLIFELGSGDIVQRIPGVAGKVARFSPNGRQVVVQSATSSGVGPLHVYSVETGDLVYALPSLCEWPPGGDASHCGDLVPADATDLAWSADGALIGMAGGSSQRLFVWDTSTRRSVVITDFLGTPGFAFSAIDFSPDGTMLAVSSKTGMWIYDTETWELVTPLIAHTGRPSWVMRFTADGSELVTAQAHSGEIRIYDTTTWEHRNLKGGVGQTRDMAISSDESLAALGASDGNIHIVDLRTGDLVELISLENRDITNVEFIDDDRRLLISSSLGPIEILTLDASELTEIARSRVTRSFTEKECEFYDIDPCPTLEEIKSG